MIGERSQATAVDLLSAAVESLDDSPLPEASVAFTRWWGDLDVEVARRARDPRLGAHVSTAEEWSSNVYKLDEELTDLIARWDVLKRDLKRFLERVKEAP